MAPRRFLNGVTTVSSSDPLGGLDVLDPTKWSVYFEDFTGPLFNTNTINNTTVTHNGLSIIASDVATVSVTTDAGALDGCLKFTTTSADNKSAWIQTASPGFVMTAGKKFIMETKLEITPGAGGAIAQQEMFVGLASYSASATAFFATDGTARAFDDGIGWITTDAATDIDLIIGENDVFDTQTAVSTYASGTWYTLTAYYDGADLHYYANGIKTGVITPNQIPVSVVGPTFYLKTGEAKIHTLLVDYLMVAKERS